MVLDEDQSRHVIQVLRMKTGEPVNLTDGKGNLLHGIIADEHKKRCAVKIQNKLIQPPPANDITIGISLIKNAARFEWFLEKATEIGVRQIIPLLCTRTEKEKFRSDRLRGILISAMLQSQQCWLPILTEPVAFDKAIASATQHQKFIAHCVNGKKQLLTSKDNQSAGSRLIVIGPEGDFTPTEIELALEHQFIPVSLGATRLRTETAGMVAATLLQIAQ